MTRAELTAAITIVVPVAAIAAAAPTTTIAVVPVAPTATVLIVPIAPTATVIIVPTAPTTTIVIIPAAPNTTVVITQRALIHVALITKHLRETEGHVQRLEQILQSLGEPLRGKKCKGMEGLIEEGKEILEEVGAPEVIDAAIISAAQRVEHYEIAAYGCLRTYAQLLGNTDADRLLQQTLAEEEATDKALTALGEGGINQAAVAAGADTEEDE